jgi:hypothetical protein
MRIKFWLGIPEGKRLLGKPRRGGQDNIRMKLREIGWKVLDWINLAQDKNQLWAPVNMVMNLRGIY